MTTNTTISPNTALAIQLAAEVGHLPKPERMKVYRRDIQSVMFREGIEGVNRYKEANPEACAIRLQGGSIAYQPKPEGYDAYLVDVALRWLDSPTALASTNVADVGRLNERFSTDYPPAKHFSEGLSKGRFKKIKAAYAARGVPLDPAKVKSMADVRQAAKAVTGAMKADQRFSTVGAISDNTLIANGRSYPIELNGHRQCIRPTIAGKRRRLYLDELEWIADWLGGGRADPLQDTNTISIMRDLPYPARNGETRAEPEPEISGLPYRIRKLNEQMRANAIPQDYGDRDPLELADI